MNESRRAKIPRLGLLLCIAASAMLPLRDVTAQSPFRGFTALTVPRETVPVGAEWIQGVGPNGDGVDGENVSVTPSLTTAAFDSAFKQQLDIAVLNYFKIGQQSTRVRSIRYNNITVHTVKDISKLNLVTGQAVLYEYLKAGKIAITVSGGLDASLKAQFDQRVADLKVDVSAGNETTVSMSGDNMILAYRVFQLGRSRTRSRSARIRLERNNPNPAPVRVMDYDIFLDSRAFVAAVQRVGGLINNTFSAADWANCEKSARIKVAVTSAAMMGMGGQPLRKNFDVENGVGGTYRITHRVSSGIVTDLITVVFGYEMPRTAYMVVSDMLRGSRVTVQRIEIPLQMMGRPQAPGWN